MLQVRGNFEKPSFDLAGYQAQLRRELTEAITIAATEYVFAGISEIPVWSGASQGTFSALASAVNAPLIITPRPGVQDRTFFGSGNSGGNIDTAGNVVSFFYETDLPHLVFNEFNDGNANGGRQGPGQFADLLNPGPYDFVGKATAAAEAAIARMSVPNPRNYVRVQTSSRRIL